MREIKFRTWNKGSEEMHCDWGIDSSLGSALWHRMFANVSQSKAMSKGYDLPKWYEHFKGYVFMQYTGLKDSNGIEIYEGDLVSYQKRNLDRAFGEGGGEEYLSFISEIKYRDQGFNVPQGFIVDLKVIGNKFENPELLEGD